jgi:hypothetical protein
LMLSYRDRPSPASDYPRPRPQGFIFGV